MRKLILFTFVLVAVNGCKSQDPNSRKSERASLLNGSAYVLVVDRTCKHPRATHPQQELRESQYAKVSGDIRYPVEFSADGMAVTVVMDKPIQGSLVSDRGGKRTFSLNSFAGGRLVVDQAAAVCEAELTIYGAGVPIISSVRGKLFEMEPSKRPESVGGN